MRVQTSVINARLLHQGPHDVRHIVLIAILYARSAWANHAQRAHTHSLGGGGGGGGGDVYSKDTGCRIRPW